MPKSIRTSKMTKIYAVKCWPTTSDKNMILMQLPRNYCSRDRFGTNLVLSFRSVVRIDGHWHLDLPYYCYAGPHRYRKAPAMLDLKLHCVKLCGDIKSLWRVGVRKIEMIWISMDRFNPRVLVREWRRRREDEKFWRDLQG